MGNCKLANFLRRIARYCNKDFLKLLIALLKLLIAVSLYKGSNNWEPEDFFDRWTLQSNYPLVIVELVDNAGVQNVKFTQYRGLNTNYSLFSDDILYPSPWK